MILGCIKTLYFRAFFRMYDGGKRGVLNVFYCAVQNNTVQPQYSKVMYSWLRKSYNRTKMNHRAVYNWIKNELFKICTAFTLIFIYSRKQVRCPYVASVWDLHGATRTAWRKNCYPVQTVAIVVSFRSSVLRMRVSFRVICCLLV